MIEIVLAAQAAADLNAEHAHHCADAGPDRDVVLDVDLGTNVEA